MKYTANPVIVDAHVIVSVGPRGEDGSIPVALSDGENAQVSGDMLARYTPVAGDYFVIQEDGYQYINPKEVFERKYSPVEEPESLTAETIAGNLQSSGGVPINSASDIVGNTIAVVPQGETQST